MISPMDQLLTANWDDVFLFLFYSLFHEPKSQYVITNNIMWAINLKCMAVLFLYTFALLHCTHVIVPLLKPKIWVRVNKVNYILTLAISTN